MQHPSEIRARARQSLRGKWKISVLAGLVAVLFIAPLNGGSVFVTVWEALGSLLENVIDAGFHGSFAVTLAVVYLVLTAVVLFSMLLSFILGGTVQLGYCRFLLKQHDGHPATFSDLFSMFDHFGTGFLQHFLRGLYTTLWSFLFVIPGTVKRYAYAMTPFILAEYPDMDVSTAITESQKMMDGHKADLWWLDITFLGWRLLGIFTFGIAYLWITPYMDSAYAAFYRLVKEEYFARMQQQAAPAAQIPDGAPQNGPVF